MTRISLRILCINITLINTPSSFAFQSNLNLSPVTTTSPPSILIRSQINNEREADSTSFSLLETTYDDRRAFIRNSIASVSSIAFISVITSTKTSNNNNNNLAWAASEDDLEDDEQSVITTPSISEGELTVSSPPPNRVMEVVVTKSENSEKMTTKKKMSPDPRFFIAGGTSAAISHGITTPIDVVKTRMQSDTQLSNMSPTEAALTIIENEGPNALTAGLSPTVIGYGIEGSLKFGVYESLKPICLSILGSGNSGEAYLVAAVCAGALASIILCPMEETRIRLVTDSTFGEGLFDGLPKLLKEEGILSPFQRGMPPMLVKQVPYTMGKQVSFDIFAGMLYTFLMGLSFVPQKEIAIEVEIGAAFLASIVACLMSQPGDVLLTATYKDGDSDGSSSNDDDDDDDGFIATIKKVYSDGGITAFFRGLNARFLHVGCIITFQLVIYDQIKQALGLPASGS